MSKINFKPIFDYIDQNNKELEKRLATKADIARLENTVNSFAKKEKDRGQEEKIVKAKTEQIEHWVIQAAEKVKVPYKP